MDKIQIIHTSDYAPVVRCRDCRYGDAVTITTIFGEEKHIRLCSGCSPREIVAEDWYCADGKRREATPDRGGES